MYHKKLFIIVIIIACGIFMTCHDRKETALMLSLTQVVAGRAPVANAGADQSVNILQGSIDLDGSGSYDPDGKNLTYSWGIRYQPPGSAIAFSDPTEAKTSFTYDTTGTYEIILRVSNGYYSSTDLVTVDVAGNNGPTADAGADQEVTVNETVTLDGSGSADPDGNPLAYTWTQVLGPAIGSGTLTGINPTFTAPSEICTIAYDLRVDDGAGNSFADRVYIFVMKKGGSGIYVATTGDDGYEGTRARPKKTIQAGINAASAAGSDVYVSAGVYNESITLSNGVSIYGGFDPSTWVRDSLEPSYTPLFTCAIQGNTLAVDGNGISNAVIEGLTITSANATTAGSGSYGIRLIYSNVTLRYCYITAGNGAPGNNGSSGADGSAGGAGAAGQDGAIDNARNGNGGSGGNGYSGGNGGRGGDGGYYDQEIDPAPADNGDGKHGEDGYIGLYGGTAGTGGSGGDYGTEGENGSGGSGGSSGNNGVHGTGGSSGSLNNNLWVSAAGIAGTDGTPGNGGGGGGGGGGQYGWFTTPGTGNGGGGGGGGGDGGHGGSGGAGGGGSFGLFIIESVITIENCTISSGNGGNGGSGGSGGASGPGGAGGAGATYGNDEIGEGGNGGSGGSGGSGGHGGGGAGGPSYSIYKYGQFSIIYTNDTSLIYGSGGSGGASSGSAGSAGESGQRGE